MFYATLIKLCTDICKRNGKSKLLWFADKDKSLNYAPKSDEMIITVHRWFANKSCPGDWLYNRLGDLAAKVTAALGGAQQEPTTDKAVWYRVRKTWADSKSQLGAYKVLANAKAKVDVNPGYVVFDENGRALYGGANITAFTPYMVNVAISDLNIRKGPGTNYSKVGKFTGKGCFTIVEEAAGQGASTWGLLKSYADGRDGWISLDFTTRI